MLSLSLIVLSVAAVEPSWHTDYDQATWQAQREKKDLVIYFRYRGELDDSLQDAEVRAQLSRYVCLELPVMYKYKGQRLLDHPALVDMLGRPGLVVVSYHDKKLSFNGEVVSAHPFVR